jgi:hypothetical protein
MEFSPFLLFFVNTQRKNGLTWFNKVLLWSRVGGLTNQAHPLNLIQIFPLDLIQSLILLLLSKWVCGTAVFKSQQQQVKIFTGIKNKRLRDLSSAAQAHAFVPI